MGCCLGDKFTTDVEVLDIEEGPTTPTRVRKPRDVLFLLLFIAMLGGMGYLAYFSIDKGDAGRFLNGADSWGNVCGREKNVPISGVPESGRDHSARPFQFLMAFSDIKMALDPSQLLNQESGPAVICVSECPTTVVRCPSLLQQNGYDLNETLIDERVCTMPYDVILPHHPVLNRCVPSQLLQAGAAIAGVAGQVLTPELTNQHLAEDELPTSDIALLADNPTVPSADFVASVGVIVEQLVTSLAAHWEDTVYLVLIALAISLSMIVLLQLFSRVVVVLIMVLSLLGTTALTAFLWYNYAAAIGVVNRTAVDQVMESTATVVDLSAANISGLSAIDASNVLDALTVSALHETTYLLPVCIVVSVITLFVITVTIWARKSFCLVISLFDEASLAIFSMPGMLVQPFWTLITMAAATGYFIVIGVYIFSVQVPEMDKDGMVGFVEDENTPFIFLVLPHIFGWLWFMEFISGCQQVILAGAVSGWFFSKTAPMKKGCKYLSFPTLKAIKDLILYNLGSVALGSLIVAVVQIMRIIIGYIERKLKGSKNKTGKMLLKCFGCCLACFERVLKFINKNAYICVAMYGDGFCSGAKNALGLLITNAQHVLALNCLSGFCLMLGKLAVVVLTGFVGVSWFTVKLGQNAPHTEYLAPVAIACLAAYIISSAFFNVFGTAIDTIFLCFCDDQKRNNGGSRPYYCSKRLQKYMDGIKEAEKERNATPIPTTASKLSTSSRTKLERPFAAKGKRTDKDGNKEVSPRTPDSLGLTSSNADKVSILVDAFDTLVDKVMYECEKSPLNKKSRKTPPGSLRQQTTPLPPIILPIRQNSLPALSSRIKMISTPLPGQVAFEEVNELSPIFTRDFTNIIRSASVASFDIHRSESDMTITMANGEPMKVESPQSVERPTFTQELPQVNIVPPQQIEGSALADEDQEREEPEKRYAPIQDGPHCSYIV